MHVKVNSYKTFILIGIANNQKYKELIKKGFYFLDHFSHLIWGSKSIVISVNLLHPKFVKTIKFCKDLLKMLLKTLQHVIISEI